MEFIYKQPDISTGTLFLPFCYYSTQDSNTNVRVSRKEFWCLFLVVPNPVLCCLGCVLWVIVLLEGEPSAESEVLSTLDQVFIKDITVLWSVQLSLNPDQSLQLKNTPTAWCCHHYASPLGWYWEGDELCLVSSRHDIYNWGQTVESWFHQTRESCFSQSASPLGAFLQTPIGLSFVFHWGEASVWPLCHKAQIGGVLQW